MQKHRTSLQTTTGWGRLEYTGWIDESLSWKQTCYIGDWSFLDELHVAGPDALRLFSDFAVNGFSRFSIGQAKHIICCSQQGKVIGEGILVRLAEEAFEFQALGPVSNWLEFNCRKGRYDAEATLRSSKFKYQVSGPTSLFLLEKLTGESLRGIGFMHTQKLRIAGHGVVFLRQGMAGEVGFEVQGPKQHAREVMGIILSVGQEFGIRRLGDRTAMINHLEACFPTVTHDYIPAVGGPAEREFYTALESGAQPARADGGRQMWRLDGCLKVKGSFEADDISAWYRSPVELGWKRNIKFDHPFHGREALETEVANPRRTIVTLVWNAQDCLDVHASLFRPGGPVYDFMEIPRSQWFCMYANMVMQGDQLIGVATSRGYSHTFRQMLSHCTIDLAFSTPGTEVTVVWGDPGNPQKLIRATVAPSPYKRDNRRADLSALPRALK